MAGASSNYAVDGGPGFSTIQASIVQIIIDEDGADTTTEISIDVTINTSETVTLPTNAQVKTTGEFPLRINGDGLSTLTGHILFGASGCRYFRINDMISAASGVNFNFNGNSNSADQHLYITDCTITNTSQENIRDFGRVYINNSSLANTSVNENISRCQAISAIDSKFDSAIGNISVFAGNTAVYLENCALKSTGAFNIEQNHEVHNLIHCVNCTFTQADSVIELDVNVDRHGVRLNLFGCVFDNFTNVIKYTNAADSDHLRIKGAPLFMRHNILSNQTGTAVVNFLNGGSTMTLAELQTAGMDSGSKAFDVTFQSTTITSADFLKHDSGDDADLLFVDPTGVQTDSFGTARKSGPISAGIFEPSAVQPPLTFFWVNDDSTGGLFSDAANWSLSSGGPGGAGVPGASDDVNFDANGLGDCQFDIAISIKSILAVAGFTATIDAATDDLNHAISGDITLQNSRVDMGDGTWTGGGNWSNNAVTTFNSNSSTLVLNGTSKTIIASKTKPFNNITIDGSYTLLSATSVSMNVNGAFLINAGKSLTIEDVLVIKTGTIFGTLTITSTLDMASGSDLLVKAGGTVDGAGTNAMSLNAKITEQAGTYSVANTTTRRSVMITGGIYGGTWLHRSNGAASTVTLGDGASQTVIFAGQVTFNAEDFDLNINNTTNNPDIGFQGNAILNETGAGGTLNWNKGTGKITYSGTGSLTSFGKDLEKVIVDGAGITVDIVDDLTATGFSLLQGGVDFNGRTFNFDDDMVLDGLHGATVDQVGVAGADFTGGGDFFAVGSIATALELSPASGWNLNFAGTVSALRTNVGFCDASAGSDFNVFTGNDDGNNSANVIFGGGGGGTVFNNVFNNPFN